jgi:hypothetical protein
MGTYSWEDWANQIINQINEMATESKYPHAPQGADVRIRLDKVTIVPDWWYIILQG